MDTINDGIWRRLESDCIDKKVLLAFVLRDYQQFKYLTGLNKPSSVLLPIWLSDTNPIPIEPATPESIDPTPSPSMAGFGYLGLTLPTHTFEKRKLNLPPCYLFGRKSSATTVDMHVGTRSSSRLSRVHFAIGLRNGLWAIQNLSNVSITVRRDLAITPGNAGLGLYHEQLNQIRLEGTDIVLELFCRDPRHSLRTVEDAYIRDIEMLNLSEPGTVPSSVTTSVPPASAHWTAADPALSLYTLEHWTSESPTCQVHEGNDVVMDPWRCELYVAQEFDASKREFLQEKIDLLSRLGAHSSFLYPEQLRDYKGSLLLLTRFQKDAFSLRELENTGFPRRLLWKLLRVVAKLHESGIVHGNINVDTVFLVGSLDPDNLLLGGFTASSSSMNKAHEDCYQILQTVKEAADTEWIEAESQPRWIGNTYLDDLWEQLGHVDTGSWPKTVLETCRAIKLNKDEENEVMATVSVSRRFSLKLIDEERGVYFLLEQVEAYLASDCVLCAGDDADRLYRAVVSKMVSETKDGKIKLNEVMDVLTAAGHNRVGWRLRHYTTLAIKWRKLSVDFELVFDVPAHYRYGLFNVMYARSLAPPGFDCGFFESMIPSCFEIRGVKKLEARGIFLPMSFLLVVASEMGLNIEYELPTETRDNSLDEFTYEKWFLLASNESAELVPINRETNMTRTCDMDGQTRNVPLSQYLKDHFKPGSYLDSQTHFNAEDLMKPLPMYQQPSSASSLTASVKSTTDPLQFRTRGADTARKVPPSSLSLAKTSA